MQRLIPTSTAVAVLRKDRIREQEGILKALSTRPLMELAGEATARLAQAIAPHAKCIWVAAGPGNNGGDGLQAACLLHRWGIDVQVSLIAEQVEMGVALRMAILDALSRGMS